MSVRSSLEPAAAALGLSALNGAAIAALADASMERLQVGADSPYLLIAEHAGNIVPAPWRDLGLAAPYLETHFAVDIGIDALTRRLSEGLRAPAVIAHYSRLFLDYNRPAGEWDFMRPDLGGIPVPGNLVVDAVDASLRRQVGWAPLEQAIVEAAKGRQALVSVHSFTPVLHGRARPWHVGILWDTDGRAAQPLMDRLAADKELVVGDNEPYDGALRGDTMFRHAIVNGFAHALVEIRQDLIADRQGALAWAGRLAPIVEEINRRPDIHEVRRFGSRTGPV